MLARDWYYNQRRQLGLDSAVASIYDRHDDSDLRARAALTMLGVQKGWRVADIGCGNGVLAVEAALLGAEVDAIDISPAMLALANIQARDRKGAGRTQPAALCSFASRPISYDLIVSEFTLHHLPDFWKLPEIRQMVQRELADDQIIGNRAGGKATEGRRLGAARALAVARLDVGECQHRRRNIDRVDLGAQQRRFDRQHAVAAADIG